MQATVNAGADFEELTKAAHARIPDLEKLYGVNRVKLVEEPRTDASPCLAYQVELDPGKQLKPEEETVQVTPPARSYPVQVRAKVRG